MASQKQQLIFHTNLASIVCVLLICIGVVPIIIYFLIAQHIVVSELTILEKEQHLHHLQDDLSRFESKIDNYESMIGFVSQLPAVFEILEKGGKLAGAIDQRTSFKRYMGVLSRAFQKNSDVVNIHILDVDKQVRFSFVKNNKTLSYDQLETKDVDIEPALLDKVIEMKTKEFYLSPLFESPGNRLEQHEPKLLLRILTPIFLKKQKLGVFCSDIDIGILTNEFPEIHWVRNDGKYLSSESRVDNAFTIFPGLKKLFHDGKPGVLANNNSLTVWDPVFKGKTVCLTLWAGKEVNLNTVQNAIRNIWMDGWRICIILLISLVIISLFVAHIIRKRSSQFLGDLKRSIFQNENAFSRPKSRINEFQEFSEDLSYILEQNRELESDRQETLADLRKALDEVKTLQGILPICSICKKVRNDKGYYEQLEDYIHEHTGVDFSHTICESCMKEHYPKEYEAIYISKKQ